MKYIFAEAPHNGTYYNFIIYNNHLLKEVLYNVMNLRWHNVDGFIKYEDLIRINHGKNSKIPYAHLKCYFVMNFQKHINQRLFTYKHSQLSFHAHFKVNIKKLFINYLLFKCIKNNTIINTKYDEEDTIDRNIKKSNYYINKKII